MTKRSYSIFKTCLNGHDLRQENSYIYDSSGKRNCRQCVMESNNTKKIARKKGSFA